MATPSFTSIVKQHERRVWATARAILGDDALAEDVCQEVFLKLHEQSGDPIVNIEAWLNRVTRNRALDTLRTKIRDRDRDCRALEAARTPAPTFSVEDGEELMSWMQSLDDEPRLILTMKFLQGHSQREIAEEIGVTEAAISQKVKFALGALRTRAHLSGAVAWIPELEQRITQTAQLPLPFKLSTGGGIAALVSLTTLWPIWVPLSLGLVLWSLGRPKDPDGTVADAGGKPVRVLALASSHDPEDDPPSQERTRPRPTGLDALDTRLPAPVAPPPVYAFRLIDDNLNDVSFSLWNPTLGRTALVDHAYDSESGTWRVQPGRKLTPRERILARARDRAPALLNPSPLVKDVFLGSTLTLEGYLESGESGARIFCWPAHLHVPEESDFEAGSPLVTVTDAAGQFRMSLPVCGHFTLFYLGQSGAHLARSFTEVTDAFMNVKGLPETPNVRVEIILENWPASLGPRPDPILAFLPDTHDFDNIPPFQPWMLDSYRPAVAESTARRVLFTSVPADFDLYLRFVNPKLFPNGESVSIPPCVIQVDEVSELNYRMILQFEEGPLSMQEMRVRFDSPKRANSDGR